MSEAEKREEENLHFAGILGEILDDLFITIDSKNQDYGDSFAKLYRKFGLQYSLIRQLEKTDRLENLIMGQGEAKVNDESVEDTIRDIAGYAILTLVTMQKEKKTPIKAEPIEPERVMVQPSPRPKMEPKPKSDIQWF